MYIPRLNQEPTIGKLISYWIWKTVFRNNGKFVAGLQSYVWGSSRGINAYDEIKDYKKSHIKPDKQYSILPTVVEMVGDYKDKIIVDLGCGTGFFCIPFADKAKRVLGIDNAQAQLDLAVQHANVAYIRKDIFTDSLPQGDIIIGSFVSNYASTVPILEYFFTSLYQSLLPNGKIILVVDLPNQKELKKFGALKKLLGSAKDETTLQITLFNNDEKICDLNATYFTPATIESTLKKVGFESIAWHKPIVSKEGIEKLGEQFWVGYTDDPELGYLTAKKPVHT